MEELGYIWNSGEYPPFIIIGPGYPKLRNFMSIHYEVSNRLEVNFLYDVGRDKHKL